LKATTCNNISYVQEQKYPQQDGRIFQHEITYSDGVF